MLKQTLSVLACLLGAAVPLFGQTIGQSIIRGLSSPTSGHEFEYNREKGEAIDSLRTAIESDAGSRKYVTQFRQLRLRLDEPGTEKNMRALNAEWIKTCKEAHAVYYPQALAIIGEEHERRFRQLIIQGCMRDGFPAAAAMWINEVELDIESRDKLFRLVDELKPERDRLFSHYQRALRVESLAEWIDAEIVESNIGEIFHDWPPIKAENDLSMLKSIDRTGLKLLTAPRVQVELGLMPSQARKFGLMLQKIDAALQSIPDQLEVRNVVLASPEFREAENKKTEVKNREILAEISEVLDDGQAKRLSELLFQLYVLQRNYPAVLRHVGIDVEELSQAERDKLTTESMGFAQDGDRLLERMLNTWASAKALRETYPTLDLNRYVGKQVWQLCDHPPEACARRYERSEVFHQIIDDLSLDKFPGRTRNPRRAR